jgi:DNA-binding transcriptional LysR family regulator
MREGANRPMQNGNSELNLRRLRYFVTVAEELSFTRAADRLHMTQQPLSAAVQKLELELGVRLFDRSPRQVALTPAGSALLPRARAAISAAEAAYEAARNGDTGVAGLVRIGVSPGGYATGAPILRELATRHPDLEFEIRNDASGPLMAELRAHRLDLLVGASVPVAPMFGRRLLRLEEALLVGHPDNPVVGREPVALEDLRDATFLVAPEALAPGYNEALIGFCVEAGFTPTTLAAPGLLAPPNARPEDWVVLLTRGAASAMQLAFEPVFARLDPPRYFRIEAIWRPDAPHGLVQGFQSAADQVAERERWMM